MAELREAGIIAGRRDGKAVFYTVSDPRARALVHSLRVLFAGLDDVTGARSATRLSPEEMMFD